MMLRFTFCSSLQDLGFGGVVGDMPGYAVVGGPSDDVGTFSAPAVLHSPGCMSSAWAAIVPSVMSTSHGLCVFSFQEKHT